MSPDQRICSFASRKRTETFLLVCETVVVQQVCKDVALDFSRYLWKKGDSFLKLGTASRVVARSFTTSLASTY